MMIFVFDIVSVPFHLILYLCLMSNGLKTPDLESIEPLL